MSCWWSNQTPQGELILTKLTLHGYEQLSRAKLLPTLEHIRGRATFTKARNSSGFRTGNHHDLRCHTHPQRKNFKARAKLTALQISMLPSSELSELKLAPSNMTLRMASIKGVSGRIRR